MSYLVGFGLIVEENKNDAQRMSIYKKGRDNQMCFTIGEDREYVDNDRLILESLLTTLCGLEGSEQLMRYSDWFTGWET
jgi:hypothetical protein